MYSHAQRVVFRACECSQGERGRAGKPAAKGLRPRSPPARAGDRVRADLACRAPLSRPG